MKLQNELHQLIYVSASTRDFSEYELKEMLSSFRQGNTEHDVTGMLLYARQSFIQVIEGRKKTLHQLFENISNDNRNSLVTRLVDNPIESRSFSRWSMGFKQLNNQHLEGLENLFDEEFPLELTTISSHKARLLLSSFYGHSM